MFVSGCFGFFLLFLMLKNQHLSLNFSLSLSNWTVLVTQSLGKEIGSDLANTTFQKGDFFLLWVFSLGKSLGKNYSQHQPQLPHNAPTHWQQPPIRNLVVFIISPALLGLPSVWDGAERGSPRARNICRRVGTGVFLLHTCSCSLGDTQQAEFRPHGILQEWDVMVPGLQAHSPAKTQ